MVAAPREPRITFPFPPKDGRCFVTTMPGVLWVAVCSFLTYKWKTLEKYAALCRYFRERFQEETVWQHLCNDFWLLTPQRFEEWPSLRSYRALYRVLEQWAVLEGYYTVPSGFPWCLLVLLRFQAGALVGEVIRFASPSRSSQSRRPAGRMSLETRAKIFEITFSADEENDFSVQASVTFPGDASGLLSRNATLEPLPATLRASLVEAEQFPHPQEIIPRWIPARLGLTIKVADADAQEALELREKRRQPLLPEEEALAALLGARQRRMRLWRPDAVDTADSIEEHSVQMFMELLEESRSLSLSLVRSPVEAALEDATAPRLSPGLYVGDYGHSMYGQYRHEVLLVEYRECGVEGLEALFARPFESALPTELTAALEAVGAENVGSMGFLVGSKVTGDVHVPAGQTTFVALCSSPELRLQLDRAREPAASVVINRGNREIEEVIRAWPGFGTLAMFGFGQPSWAPGWLVQLEPTSDGDRFGFVWSRNQETIVLEYVQAQSTSPFLSRKWLPESLR